MVKLGDAFIELSAVEAITPIRDGGGYAVFLTGGRIMNLNDVTEDEVLAALYDSGYVGSPYSTPHPVEPKLTIPERAELREVYIRGYRFAAKDQSGITYAYTICPNRGTNSWVNDDAVSKVWRLRNDFSALGFMDETPLDLSLLFAEVSEC